MKAVGRSIAAAVVSTLPLLVSALGGCSRGAEAEALPAHAPAIPLRLAPRPAREVRRERAQGIASLQASRAPDAVSAGLAPIGRRIFFDRALGGGVLACTRCHDPSRGGAGAPVVMGREGRLDVPALVDLAAYTRFGTEGKATTLASYMTRHLAELGGDAAAREAALDAAHGGPLRAMFAAGDGSATVSVSDLAALALSTYLATLVSPSRVDAFLAGDARALSDQEAEGFDAFFARGCVSCHEGGAFGGRRASTLGLALPWPGDAPLGEHAEWKPRRARRVASLRHVAYSAPFFHEGAVDALPTAVQLMAAHQLGLMIADGERDAIVAFLLALAGPNPEGLRPPEDGVAPAAPAPPRP